MLLSSDIPGRTRLSLFGNTRARCPQLPTDYQANSFVTPIMSLLKVFWSLLQLAAVPQRRLAPLSLVRATWACISHPSPRFTFTLLTDITTHQPHPSLKMTPKPPDSDWVSTPAVTADGFSFVNNEFFAEASNHNLHRRASPADVKAHFSKGGSDKDHPAHWFEAQLKHYGLPMSKTKSVARMRLLDACNANKLVVPPELVKLEGRLKKEWAKNDRESKKKKAKDGTSAVAGSKRKADDIASSTTKKTKTETSTATPARKSTTPKQSAASSAKPKTASTKPAASTKPKQTARAAPGTLSQAPTETGISATSPYPTKQTARCVRGARNQGFSRSTTGSSAKSTSSAVEASPPASRPKQTARCNRGGHSSSPSRAAQEPVSTPTQTSRPKQTARRSRAFGMQARTARGPSPDIKRESPDIKEPMDVDLPALGYINGDYDIDCPYVRSQWSFYDDVDFEMTLTLSGREVWASFDLGIVSGVMFFPERPWHSSQDEVFFKWRGREAEGPILYSDHNSGWIRFLGGGYFEGKIDYMSIEFQGQRMSGQDATSSRSASNLMSEWDGYSEEEYEYERVARWR